MPWSGNIQERETSDRCPTPGTFAVEVTWGDGGKDLVDLADMIGTHKVFSPLRSGDMFRHVRVGEHGWDIRWTDAIDVSADTLWRLARQEGEP